jgi:hypothetical protein
MRWIVLTIIFLSLMATALAQGISQPKAIPSRRLTVWGEMSHLLSEIYLDLEASAGKPGDMAAMRICTKDPLPVALFTAVVSPLGIGEDLASGVNSRIAYSAERVMILRSPDCPVTHPLYVPVEFWGIPQGAALPPAVESVKLCQIRVSGSSWIDVTTRTVQKFRAALREILAEWREDSSGIIVVYGDYDVRPGSSMRSAIREAKAFFRRNGLPRNKYFARLKPSSFYEQDNPRPEPKFPNLVRVRVAKDCEAD